MNEWLLAWRGMRGIILPFGFVEREKDGCVICWRWVGRWD